MYQINLDSMYETGTMVNFKLLKQLYSDQLGRILPREQNKNIVIDSKRSPNPDQKTWSSQGIWKIHKTQQTKRRLFGTFSCLQEEKLPNNGFHWFGRVELKESEKIDKYQPSEQTT